MTNIRQLVENKDRLDYPALCSALIEQFGVSEPVNWDSILPASQQQELFGGEVLRLVETHPLLAGQKDIRPITIKKGSVSQMLFFYVSLTDKSLPKKQIEQITKRFIKGAEANRYIIWFFGNKEATDLKVVLSGKEGKKIVLKTLPFGINQPYYKTYDFILYEVHQKVNYLFVEPTDLWKALWKAFDISIINRNFYDEIKSAFTGLLKQLNKKGTPLINEEDKVQFAIRLIGRIIFCWFLKRKEVLHDAAISSEAVKAHSQTNYYHELLEPLFFDVLNTPNKERKGGLSKIIANYPFLNGGLFEAQETDYKHHMLLNIDNDWFYNLFSKTLESYNFTVDENSSSNAEIAIDPEMLGRIFENLLAEQNPETGDSARKATGSFYTPREIVDYMVEQSIAEYLKTALTLDGKLNIEIEDFVHTQVLPDTLVKHEERISEELSKIKVLDPACGSGAFPIGILQKIVALKQQLHPKAKNYKLKLDTIQNSIYGVDIQPMAVELSRLRCWLSLVVDEDPKDIKALPNLDFKFVCADSLMVVGKMNHQLDLSKSAERIEELKDLRTEFFIANGKRKKELEKKFKQIQTSLNNNFLEWDGKSKLVENIASWKPFDNHKTEWFDAFWMFGLNDGFDVIIANPPYVNIVNLPEAQRKYLQSNYTVSKNKVDLFAYFIEKSHSLLKDNAELVFIIPQTWKATDSFSKFREFLFSNFQVTQIVNLKMGTFDAIVKPLILILKRKYKKQDYLIEIRDFEFQIIDRIDITEVTENENYVIDTESTVQFKKIFKLIEKNTVKLEDVLQFTRGIKTSDDKRFIHSTAKTNDHKKIFRGKNIKAYSLVWAGEFLWYRPDLMKEKVGCLPHSKELFEVPEKIITQRVNSSMQLLAAFDEEQNYFLDTTNVSRYESLNSNYSIKYILALLNSKIVRFWYCNKYRMPTIGIYELHSIPLKEISKEKQQPFISLVNQILHIKKSANQNSIHQSVTNNLITKQLEEIIDGMTLELYFSEEMVSKKVNIIDLVEKELEKTKNKDTTESIYNFYKSVSHPDSEIRNRILSFAIVSPDILKPILQG